MKKLYGKILIIALPIIGALLLLLPTYRAGELQKIWDATLEQSRKAPTPADSLEIIERFEKQYGEDFMSAKKSKLKLGLDLRGGMYITLEVDVLKMVEDNASKASIDDLFTQAIDRTRSEIKTSNEDAVDVFQRNLKDLAQAAGRTVSLADYFDVDTRSRETDVEKSVISQLKKNEDEAMEQSMLVFKQRFDAFGVAELNILKQGNRRLMVEIPGATNEKDIMSLLQTTARLEFKLVKSDDKVLSAFYNIDKYLSMQIKREKEFGKDTTKAVVKDTAKIATDSAKTKDLAVDAKAEDTIATAADSTADSVAKAKADTANPYAGLSEDETRARYLEDHPFTTLFETFYIPEQKNARSQPIYYQSNLFPKDGSFNFTIYEPTIKRFREILARPDILDKLPEGIQILLSKPEKIKDRSGKEIRMWSFYPLKKEAELKGDAVTSAVATFDQNENKPIVSMTMNSEGAEKWARITGENLKKRIAIILDDQVYSAPTVQSKIVGGSSVIEGVSAEEAKLLKTILNAGKLKVPVQVVEQRIVGPSLGEDSIRSGFISIIVAIILVILFMSIYYRTGGLVANIAVIINLLLVVAALTAFQGTLTLPGIAGLILTLGMAVDANVLIFERIREELYRGRSIRSAIDEGYSKAMSAIIDSNVTTFLTGLILYFFGTGPIQGFAMTLMIGILATLFTQIIVTRAIIDIMLSRGATTLNIGQPQIMSQE